MGVLGIQTSEEGVGGCKDKMKIEFRDGGEDPPPPPPPLFKMKQPLFAGRLT